MFPTAIKKHAETDAVQSAMPSTWEETILDAFSAL